MGGNIAFFGFIMAPMTKVSVQACLAEFVAMTLFVLIGCGTAMSNPSVGAWALEVALAFGLGITVLAIQSIRYANNKDMISQIWDHMWIFWVAPLIGSAVAVGLYGLMQRIEPKEDTYTTKDDGVVPDVAV